MGNGTRDAVQYVVHLWWPWELRRLGALEGHASFWRLSYDQGACHSCDDASWSGVCVCVWAVTKRPPHGVSDCYKYTVIDGVQVQHTELTQADTSMANPS